jgi:sialate O-acetylesterase
VRASVVACAAGVLLASLAATTVDAAPRLPAIIADHMVLQRDAPVPIWGWADPGERIAVRIEHARAEAVTDADGRWRVTLPALSPGGPFELRVHGTRTLRVKDVLVGEVWLCAGQSNMSFPLGSTDTAGRDVPAANHPALRLFTVPQTSALHPMRDTRGVWRTSTPETAAVFSAVAYHFGLELQKQLGVPIGLVHASWSGTAGEEWIDPAALRADPVLQPIADRWDRVTEDAKAIYRRPEPVRLDFDDFALVRPDGTTVPLSNFDDGSTRNLLGGDWIFDWATAPRARFALTTGRGAAGWAASITGSRSTADFVLLHMLLRPWSAPMDLREFRALRFNARGKGAFKVRLQLPSITDFDDYATSPITGSRAWTPVTVAFRELAQAGWGRKLPLTLDAATGVTIEAVPAHPTKVRPPGGLYRGMIQPIIPYAIRGVVWYQGESNNARAFQYRRLLPALIRDWRAAWGQGDFPFGIVQLASYGAIRAEPRGSRWAELREAQRLALVEPATGLVVAIDQGDPADVHPKHKAEVARRLALWALGTVYGSDVVYEGPSFESMRIERDRLRLHFRTRGALASRGGAPLAGFAVAGADRVFHWADASIDGDDVVVRTPAVRSPVAARYAWADSPTCTLVNESGLPASPFRTDDWPMKTAAER